MDIHFVDANGNHFVVPDAPEGYERDDATQIAPPPSIEHRWIDGEWRIPAEPEPTIPASVTMRQARLALLGAGILDDAEAALAAMPGTEGRAAQIEWEYATELRRDHPLVAGLGAGLGLNDAAIDGLFVQAAQIV